MRVLIQNYASSEFTEPLYLCESLNIIDSAEAWMWSSSQVSAFDMLDTARPDLLISHFGYLTHDIIKYLSGKKIDVIVNVTGATQDVVDSIDGLISSSNVNCPFIFTNTPGSLNTIIQRKTKLISVMHGADIFLTKQSVESPDYEADLGIISNYYVKDRLSEITDKFDVHHFLSTSEEISDKVDVSAPSMFLYGLYEKYKNIIITQDTQNIPQALFDAIFYGNKVFYLPKYESQKKKMAEVISSVLKLKGNITNLESNEIDHQAIKKKVIESHTCLSRAKRIFLRLKHSEIVSELESKIKELRK